MIAKVLNMLSELQGNNYYSKVFKIVNYKLQNSTFLVVIIISCELLNGNPRLRITLNGKY